MSTHPDWERRSQADSEVYVETIREGLGGAVKVWTDTESGFGYATLSWRATVDGELVQREIIACAEDQAQAMIRLSHQVAGYGKEIVDDILRQRGAT